MAKVTSATKKRKEGSTKLGLCSRGFGSNMQKWRSMKLIIHNVRWRVTVLPMMTRGGFFHKTLVKPASCLGKWSASINAQGAIFSAIVQCKVLLASQLMQNMHPPRFALLTNSSFTTWSWCWKTMCWTSMNRWLVGFFVHCVVLPLIHIGPIW